MNNNGHIKIHRQITQWEWYDDANAFRLFFHLLVTVNWYDNMWHGVLVKRGSRIVSYDTLSTELGMSRSTIRSTLKKLISTHEVTHEYTPQYGLFTVVNYNKYQDGDTQTNSQSTHKLAVKPHLIKKDKEIKNIYTSNSFLEIQEKFNSTVTKLPSIKSISQKRETALKALLKLYTQDQIFEVFEKTQNSDFLTGVKTEWKASFDWIINQNNFLKILEGNYENKNTQKEKPVQVKAEIEIIPR